MSLDTIPDPKILKKGVQIRPKLKRRPGTQEGHSALPKCCLAQIVGTAQGLPNWDKVYLLQFFRDKDKFQFVSDLIF